VEDGRQVTGHIGSGAQASRREGTSVADTASGTSTQRGGASTGGPSALRRDGAPRRTRVVLRKIGPWSILKFSLLFYFCVMLVVLVAMYILYAVMDALGTLDSLVKLLTEFSLVNKGFQLHTAWIFERLFVFGVLLVVLWSIINVFAIFLYNLISDVVGGIEITLAEKR
jgi:Transmembrane domain of unknown function (DUF3566)